MCLVWKSLTSAGGNAGATLSAVNPSPCAHTISPFKNPVRVSAPPHAVSVNNFPRVQCTLLNEVSFRKMKQKMKWSNGYKSRLLMMRDKNTGKTKEKLVCAEWVSRRSPLSAFLGWPSRWLSGEDLYLKTNTPYGSINDSIKWWAWPRPPF